MGDIIPLHGTEDHPEDDIDFVADLARFDEELISEQSIRAKYHARFNDAMWKSFANNEELLRAVDRERQRRIRDGSSAREKALRLYAGVPTVLGSILHNDSVPPKTKIESAKEIRAIATGGQEGAAPMGDRFQITIILDADTVEKYDKSIAINAEDVDPHHPTPPEILAAIATKKNGNGDGGDYL